jgi:pyridoxal phosphate enzyme (YggS family)
MDTLTTLEHTELRERIASVQACVAAAAHRAGRDPAEITLVAVSKGHEAALVAAAYEAGLRIFGENRVEEAGPKIESLAGRLGPDAQWHMIGHVQSRKAAQVIPWAACVQSVDGEKLARRLNQFAAEAGKTLPVLLEVNVSGEEAKYGLAPTAVPALVEAMAAMPALRLQGLMTVAPITDEPETVRPVFAGLRRLRDELAQRFPTQEWRHLSMGMSGDYEVAITEGATIVRIGTAIFGERPCALR